MSKETKKLLVERLSAFKIEIVKTEPLDFAINTGGGIDLKEINPNTYESIKVPHLYFIGEVIDLNPRTNGYNITTCYATANKCMEAIDKKYQ